MQLFGIGSTSSRMDAGGKRRSRQHAASLRMAALLAAGFHLSMFAGCAHQPMPPERVGAPERVTLDRLVDEVIEHYHLPGIAVGVIHEGEIIYTRTSGELVAGSGEKIDADTLFKIASNSKAMTTGVLARLVDAGKLQWHDPVVKYLPGFRMSDPWITREMQVRDLLIHNSGLRAGAGDLMLWPEPNLFTRADITAALAHLKPIDSFRTRYSYDNLMYVVAGEVAATAAGASYEELVQRELFAPLGLTRCQVGEWNRDEVGNVAQPHMRQDDHHVVIRRDDALIPQITSAAAGGIRCSLNDMLTWMRMWLDPELKSARGEPWLTPEQRNAVWAAQMPMPVSRRQRDWFDTRFSAYGFGWRLSDVDGEWSVGHTGTLAGMFSALVLFPDKRHGFVFLINGEAGEARVVLSTMLTKQLIAPHEMLSVAEYAAALSQEDAQDTSPAAPDTSSRQPTSASTLREKLGVYRDPWFGEVTLCPNDDRVHFRSTKSPRLSGDVMQVGDRWLVDWFDESVSAEAWLNFANSDSSQVTLTMAKVDPEEDFSYDYEDLSFTRIEECQ
jgi:CubicO group peptidase (beta-lactamase class C family)